MICNLHDASHLFHRIGIKYKKEQDTEVSKCKITKRLHVQVVHKSQQSFNEIGLGNNLPL